MVAKVLPPIKITGAMVTASSVDEPVDFSPEWVSGATYIIGNKRSRAATGRKYRRLIAGAGAIAPESDPTNWADESAEPVGMKWVSGATYIIGNKRTDAGRLYNRITNGAGATAPAITPLDWTDIGAVPAEVPWLATEVYAIGDEVTRDTTHSVYVSTATGVHAGLPEETPLRWKRMGATNKFAAFDNYRATALRANGPLTQTVRPGVITDMAFYALEGDALHVVCKHASSGTVYLDETFSLGTYTTGELEWEFWYGNPAQQDQVRIMALYPADAQVEITLTPSLETGWAGIGIWAMGSFGDIGEPEFGFKAKLVDHSYIDIDDAGEVVIEKGLSAKDLVGTCVTDSDAANAVVDQVSTLLGVPCAVVISGLTKYDYLSVFGLLSADVTADNEEEATVAVNVRGFI